MRNYASAILDGPVNIGALKELSTLTGRTVTSLKKAWESGTPVFVVAIGIYDEFESSTQTLKKLTEWADRKGIAMTLCGTNFDPDGSPEAKQFGKDRSLVFDRLRAWHEMMIEEGHVLAPASKEAGSGPQRAK